MTMQQQESVIPFKREAASPLQLPPANQFVRVATARIIAQTSRISALEVVRARFPNDRIAAEWITRAAVAPAMTSVAGWAAELAPTMVADGLTAMGPASAAREILSRALRLSFDGFGHIT